MPCRRSSNTLGSAKVVDWKMMLETAVVGEHDQRDAQQQALVIDGPACDRRPASPRRFSAAISSPSRERSTAMPTTIENVPGTMKAMRQPPWSMK